MKKTDFQIVLCRPQESANIGSVCRAMKTMGISCLRIVGQKSDYDETRVQVLAVHGFDLWQGAKFFASLEEAISDCTIAAGTTRRKGARRKGRTIFPKDFASLAMQSAGKAAVVFGNERTGLTDEELSLCNAAVEIPADKKNGSLNLSHAVQIVCYEIFCASCQVSPAFESVTQQRLLGAAHSICSSLQSIGFYRMGGLSDSQNFFRDILSRAAATESEVARLEKIFFKIEGIYKKISAGNFIQNAETCKDDFLQAPDKC